MIINLDTTINLTSIEFIEILAINLWNPQNIHFLESTPNQRFPEYFYTSSYLIEFDTEFQMQGLITLLSNTPAKKFQKVIVALEKIESLQLLETLLKIKSTINKFGFEPENVGVITDEKLINELSLYERGLYDNYKNILLDLEKYLIKIRTR